MEQVSSRSLYRPTVGTCWVEPGKIAIEAGCKKVKKKARFPRAPVPCGVCSRMGELSVKLMATWQMLARHVENSLLLGLRTFLGAPSKQSENDESLAHLGVLAKAQP